MHVGHHEVWIGADAADVFAALTTKKGLDGWWGPVLAAAPEAGSLVEFDHGLGAPLTMQITELVDDRRVVWKCVSEFSDPANPASEWFGQTFEFEIAARAEVELLGTTQDVTIVRLRNDGWPDDARWFGFCSTAWSVTLEQKLKLFCESGEARSGAVGDG